MTTKLGVSATFAAALVLALAACGREADRASRAEAPSEGAGRASPASYTQPQTEREAPANREAAAARFDDGKPVWASNRQRSGDENAQKQFERNGADFKAGNVDDYVRKAHAFLDAPPKGAQTVTRSNGDVLYYDPKANVFVVADRQGAPRTMFKPRDGMSYWLQQKQRMAQRDTSRDGRRSRSSDDASSDESAG
jgi:pyocin large subunit-like protein